MSIFYGFSLSFSIKPIKQLSSGFICLCDSYSDLSWGCMHDKSVDWKTLQCCVKFKSRFNENC